jgi:hypothetical protein
MKLSVIGLVVAGAAAVLLQTGVTVPASKALAAETCIISNVALYKGRCAAGAKLETHAGTGIIPGGMAEPTATPTVTPTAGPPEGCIKSNIALYKNRCPVGV